MSVTTQNNSIIDGLTFNVDAGNPKSWSPNVHPYPLDIYTWAAAGGANQATLSRDYTIERSPAGGIPMLMATANPGTSAYVGTYNSSTWNLAPAANGQTWTVSFWVKGSSAFSASMLIFEANSSGNYTTYGQGYYNVTTGWTKVSYSYTMTQATTAYVQMRFDCYNTSVNMWVDGIQVEQGSAVTSFNPRSNPSRIWTDLSENKINLTPTGTINYTTLGGVYCFGFNSSMYWSSTTTDAQKTDYRYGTTIEMWLYNQTKSVRRTVFQKNGNSYQSYEQEIAMTWETDNGISGYRNYNSYDYSNSSALTNNSWNHVVAVLMPHLTAGQWYINGSAAGSWTQRALLLPPKANEIVIGNGYAGIVDTGGVAMVRTYYKMFDAEDVLKNYNATKGRFGL